MLVKIAYTLELKTNNEPTTVTLSQDYGVRAERMNP